MSKKTPKLASVSSAPAPMSVSDAAKERVLVETMDGKDEGGNLAWGNGDWRVPELASSPDKPSEFITPSDWMTLTAELEQLRAWKAEQMEVLNQLQLQECAKYLPVKLGESIPEAILPALKRAMEPKSPLFSVDLATGVATPVYPEASHEAIKAAKRPQTSGIQISMVVNGDVIRFDGSWLREIGL